MEKNYVPLCAKNDLIYTSCYCEENIWKLLERLVSKNAISSENLFAVFISNPNKTIPIWYQSKSENENEPVVWDYHVIAIHKDTLTSTSYVYDLDTTLNFPELFKIYMKNALPQLANEYKKYHRLYRVISADYYLNNFASDRSHMINKLTGDYLSTPPEYPCIQSKVSKNNIQEFISMNLDQTTSHGLLMNQNEFENFFKLN